MKGSYCSDLTGKSLVFWISGHLREAVVLLVHVYCLFQNISRPCQLVETENCQCKFCRVMKNILAIISLCLLNNTKLLNNTGSKIHPLTLF